MAMRGILSRIWSSSRGCGQSRLLRAAMPSRGCTTIAQQSEDEARDQSKDEATKESQGERKTRAWRTKEAKDKELVKLLQNIAAKPQESTQVVKEWIKNGNRLLFKNYLEIAKTLAEQPKCKREAIKLLKTTRREKLVKAKTPSLILELAMVLREFGAAPAERFYSRLPEEVKTEELQVAFLTSLAKNYPKHALAWVERLKPTTPELHNLIIQVYWKLKMHDKVMAAYTALRSDTQLLPRLETYLLMLKYKERLGGGLEGLEGLEEETEAFVRKIRIRKASISKMNHLMEVFAYLGDAEKVEEIYKLVKSPKPPLRPLRDSFRVAARSFGRLGMVQRVEEVVEDSKSYGKVSFGQANLIEVYAKMGMMDKAEDLLEQMDKKKLNFAPYDALVRGYLARKDTNKALERFKQGCAGRPVIPSYETVAGMLPVLEELKFPKTADGLMQNYLHYAAGDLRLYKSLLKVYIACKYKANPRLVSRFKIEPDNEAKELLSQVKFKTLKIEKKSSTTKA